MKYFMFVFSIIVLLFQVGCSSQQNINTLDSSARKDSDAIRTQTVTAYNDISNHEDVYTYDRDYPLLTGRIAPVQRELPSTFKKSFNFNPLLSKRLIDIVKIVSAETGLIVSARDDVYNPTSTSINATDNNGNIDSSAVQLANTVRTESNIDVAERVRIPEGAMYSGDVAGFLDYISSLLNIDWSYIPSENKVLLSRYTQESYRLFIPPSTGDGGTNIWEDTKTGISMFLSQGGSVEMNQSSGIISVVDTKDVQRQVKNYIININEGLSKEVVFKLEILSFDSTDFESSGFNINLIHDDLNGSVNFTGPGVSIPGAAGITGTVLSSGWAGSKVLQQNLREKLEANVALSRILRTSNNQSARETLKQIVPVIDQYTPPIVNNGVTTPGGVNLSDIEVGFDLTITPSIMQNGSDMSVRIDMKTSNIDEIVDIPIGSNGEIVQSARQRFAEYEHIFPIKNQDTIVISGYSDRTNAFKQSNPNTEWLSWLFSSAEDKAARTYYVVLLTANVHNKNGDIY